MLSIPHALTGAFIASKIPYPVVYIPMSVGMHYLCDWIPHWDMGTGLSTGKRKRSTAIILELFELGVTAVLIYYFFIAHLGIGFFNISGYLNSPQALHILVGALFGIMPDLIEAPRNFLKWEPWFIKPLNKLHGSFHHSTPNMVVGLLPQIILVGFIWFLK